MNRLRPLTVNFKNIFSYGLCIFLLTACAGHQKHLHSEERETKDADKIMKKNITLKPSETYEECFELEMGQKLFYKFDSDKPVNFNVHFHVEKEIHYPVQQNGVTRHDGMIDPDDKHFQLNTLKHYCLMWENPEMNQVNLSYECIVEKK